MDLGTAGMTTSVAALRRVPVATSAMALRRGAKMVSVLRRVRVAVAPTVLRRATMTSAAARRANDVAPMGQAVGPNIIGGPTARVVHLPVPRRDLRRAVRVRPGTTHSLL